MPLITLMQDGKVVSGQEERFARYLQRKVNRAKDTWKKIKLEHPELFDDNFVALMDSRSQSDWTKHIMNYYHPEGLIEIVENEH